MRYAIVTIVSLFVLACTYEPTSVRITNCAAVPLQDLRVSGNGFEETVPIIRSGESVTIHVTARGETGARVRFTARGHPYDIPEQGYFEGGGDYVVQIVVEPNFSVRVEGDLAPAGN